VGLIFPKIGVFSKKCLRILYRNLPNPWHGPLEVGPWTSAQLKPLNQPLWNIPLSTWSDGTDCFIFTKQKSEKLSSGYHFELLNFFRKILGRKIRTNYYRQPFLFRQPKLAFLCNYHPFIINTHSQCSSTKIGITATKYTIYRTD